MHFIRPEWFFALIPLAILLWLLNKHHGVRSSWDQYIAPHLATVLLSNTPQRKNHSLLYLTLTWFIAVIALSGPALHKTALPVYESTQGRVIAMDMSLSMYANDLTPNRLAQSKYRAKDLVDGIKEGETGLIAYAGDAFTISPLTQDKATLLNLLPTLTPDIMPVKGSNVVAALKHAKTLLSQSGHLDGDIVLFTDGIIPSQLSEAKAVLKDSPYRLAILAFGSEQGAPIQLPNGQLLRDNQQQVVIAKTDFNLLQSLADSAHGTLIATRTDGQDIQHLIKWLTPSTATKESDLHGETWQDLGGYIALLLLIPALFSFRHGVIGALALVLVFQPSQPVYANTWDDLWQTQNQQAAADYQAQHYEAAADKFEQTQWQASARYKAGQYDQALTGFELDNSANGFYNQGNALMQLGQYAEAEARYQQALEIMPDLKPAQDNLALAQQLQQQQDSQDSNEQQDQDKTQSSEDKKQSGEQHDSNQHSDEKNQQDNKQQDPSQQQNDSQSEAKQQDQQDQQENDADSDKSRNSEPSQSDNQPQSQPQPKITKRPWKHKPQLILPKMIVTIKHKLQLIKSNLMNKHHRRVLLRRQR